MGFSIEYNEKLLHILYDIDIVNYNIQIDKELGYYIIQCWIMLGYWKNDNELKDAFKICDTLCKNNVISNWRDNECIDLVDIPKGIYEDCWMFYLQYTMQYEMSKLINLNDLKIMIPIFELNRGVDVIKSEIEQLWDVKLNENIKSNDNEIC